VQEIKLNFPPNKVRGIFLFPWELRKKGRAAKRAGEGLIPWRVAMSENFTKVGND
jgi:hypothetical protein